MIFLRKNLKKSYLIHPLLKNVNMNMKKKKIQMICTSLLKSTDNILLIYGVSNP
jgi:hypothetical protein